MRNTQTWAAISAAFARLSHGLRAVVGRRGERRSRPVGVVAVTLLVATLAAVLPQTADAAARSGAHAHRAHHAHRHHAHRAQSAHAYKAWARGRVGHRQFHALNKIWTRESGWNRHAKNPQSGAYGIPQALPAKKLSGAGSDWAWNGYTQMRWGIHYIDSRYGSPVKAWAFWRAHHWY